MKRFSFYNVALWLVIAGIMTSVYQMVAITLPYFSFRTDIGFLLTKQSVLHKAIWRIAFYTHITLSLPVLLVGALQFVPALLRRYPAVHRACGNIYVLCILTISAPSGLIMGFYANGGAASKVSFCILSVLWWWFTFRAYLQIRKREIRSHIHFMTYSYALTLSAITLRMYVLLLDPLIDLPSRDMYTLVAWISWVPNLLVAWMLLRFKLIKVPGQAIVPG